MKRNIWIILLAILLIAGTVNAQSFLSSRAYGTQREGGTVRALGMGMASLAAPDSLGMHLLVPAMWYGPATTRITYSQGWAMANTSTADGSITTDRMEVSGLGLAVAIGTVRPWFVGLALAPYTRMDYRWDGASSGSGETAGTSYQQGEGGLSQLLLGCSVPLKNNMRLGLGVRGIFGELTQNWGTQFNSPGMLSAYVDNTSRYQGLGGSLSFAWRGENGWSFGAYGDTPVKVTVEQQQAVFSSSSVIADSVTELPDPIDLPISAGAGIGYKLGGHQYAIEAVYHMWGMVEHPVSIKNQVDDAMRISAGWEYTQDVRPFDPFYKSWIWRAGGYMQEQYGLSPNGKKTRKLAVTGGLSIPYFFGRSRIDLAVEAGLTGNKTDDGAEEKTIGISLGFNHSEQWFVGRRAKR